MGAIGENIGKRSSELMKFYSVVREIHIDPALTKHRADLKDENLCTIASRMYYVGKHIHVFKPFLTNAIIASAQSAYQHGEPPKFEEIQYNYSLDNPPKCLDPKVVSMRDYQLVGLNYMLRMHSDYGSCLLGDE
ncbi:hypothetical protein SARC_17305, partial [Sphaeroforma arctica JP610]